METTPESTPRDEGLRLLRAGQVSEAISALERAVGENAEDAQAHMYLGIACHQAGEGPRAAQHLEESIRLEASARAYYNLGLVYESSNRVEEAKAQYCHALMLDSNYANARQALDKLGAKPAGQSALDQTQTVSIPAAQSQTQVISPPPVQGYAQPSPYGGPGAAPAGVRSGPEPYILRQIEEQKKIQQAHRTLIRSGVIYGAICGAGVFLLLNLAAVFLFSIVSIKLALVYLAIQVGIGTVYGLLIGLWIGYTAGNEMSGALAGAALGFVYGFAVGLIEGGAIGVCVGVGILCAIFGTVGGLLIGWMVTNSVNEL